MHAYGLVAFEDSMFRVRRDVTSDTRDRCPLLAESRPIQLPSPLLPHQRLVDKTLIPTLAGFE